MKLTDDLTARLALAEEEAERIDWDDALPGFGHRLRRIAPGRVARRWICQFKVGGRTRRMTLGNPATVKNEPVVRCAEARRKARELLAKVRLGDDPQAARIAERRAVTFQTLATQYITDVAVSLRAGTQDAIKRHLQTHARELHRQPVGAITRADVASLLNAIARDRGPVAANRARATLSAFFAWCVIEHELPGNPVANTRKRPEVSRDRVLNDAELAAIWQATHSGSDFDRIIRLLMLTACRRDEVGRMRWSEISGDVFVLPASRTKNHLKHEVPLHPLAIAQLPPRMPERDAVFGRGDTGFSGWSRCKARLDAQLSLPVWTPHDLRRSCATWLSENGTEPQHVDALLNHVTGVAKAGVSGIYNRSTYSVPKRQALTKWGDHIARITGQDLAKVAVLAGAVR